MARSSPARPYVVRQALKGWPGPICKLLNNIEALREADRCQRQCELCRFRRVNCPTLVDQASCQGDRRMRGRGVLPLGWMRCAYAQMRAPLDLDAWDVQWRWGDASRSTMGRLGPRGLMVTSVP